MAFVKPNYFAPNIEYFDIPSLSDTKWSLPSRYAARHSCIQMFQVREGLGDGELPVRLAERFEVTFSSRPRQLPCNIACTYRSIPSDEGDDAFLTMSRVLYDLVRTPAEAGERLAVCGQHLALTVRLHHRQRRKIFAERIAALF